MNYSVRTITELELDISNLAPVAKLEIDTEFTNWHHVYAIPKRKSNTPDQSLIEAIKSICSKYLQPDSYSVVPIREGSGIIYAISF